MNICINNWANIAYGEEFEQSEALAKRFRLFQIYLWGLGGDMTPAKFCNFFPHLSLGAVFLVII